MKAIILTVTIVIFFASCLKPKKYDLELPPISDTASGKMGFLYNGSTIWRSVFEKSGLLGGAIYEDMAVCYLQMVQDSLNEFTFNGSMYLKARDGQGKSIQYNSEITIYLEKATLTSNTYLFDTVNNSRIFFRDELKNADYNNVPNSFMLTVSHIDSIQKIISGTFAGTLYRSSAASGYNMDDSLVMHDGRFDLKYFP